MARIRAGFSADGSSSPWGFENRGLTIFPNGNLRAFSAACSGTVGSVQLRQSSATANWEVAVLINCDLYVPNTGEYFPPLSAAYVFEPMSGLEADGQAQRALISVGQGQTVAQGEAIGQLSANAEQAHVQFSLLKYATDRYSALGVSGIAVCPETHFSAGAANSVLNLLRRAWPDASMCYRN